MSKQARDRSRVGRPVGITGLTAGALGRDSAPQPNQWAVRAEKGQELSELALIAIALYPCPGQHAALAELLKGRTIGVSWQLMLVLFSDKAGISMPCYQMSCFGTPWIRSFIIHLFYQVVRSERRVNALASPIVDVIEGCGNVEVWSATEINTIHHCMQFVEVHGQLYGLIPGHFGSQCQTTYHCLRGRW